MNREKIRRIKVKMRNGIEKKERILGKDRTHTHTSSSENLTIKLITSQVIIRR